MLVINKNGESGASLPPLAYVGRRGGIGRFVLPVTRWLRAVHAEKYMTPAPRHLDIGCGDGYFLRRSRCEERYGLDKLLGDEVKDTLDFPDAYFDYVTLLAVVEHLPNPGALLEEIARVLKPGGKLILTTPKQSAEWILKLYARDIEEEHETYFDPDTIEKLSAGIFELVGHHTFIFGLNQAFCLRKPPADGSLD
ncbi:MAG: methyltransferase domain-containing protein [Nitrospinales bacterium]